MRACVVGAGASGLCAARHLLAAGMRPTVLERAPVLGGTWVYTDDVGLDARGLPVHTSMYRNLRTNLPKEIMGFPDFPIPESGRSYLPAEEMLAYLRSYADAHGVTERVEFERLVKLVRPLRGPPGWEVISEELATGRELREEYDCVLVCSGHYSSPFVPDVEGIAEFAGDVLHSHDYRVPERFRGRRVLVVGAGPSGVDIALEIAAVAERVLLGGRAGEGPRSALPGNLALKPEVASVARLSAAFADGSREDVDVVLFCTGYVYDFPFLHPSCGVTAEGNRVRPLYRHLVNVEHPTMCLVGIPYYVCAFSMFDLQARYFAKALRGGFALPSRERMLEDSEAEFAERVGRGLSTRQAHMMGPDQGEYYDALSDEAGLPRLPPVLAEVHAEATAMMAEEPGGFRNYLCRIVDERSYSLEAL